MSNKKTRTRRRLPAVAYSEALADQIVAQIVEKGRLLVDICGDTGMPNRASVYRWMAERPEFGQRVDRAREAAADHSVSKARALVEKCTSETANADRVKISHYQWEATRMAPKKYSERRIQELTGKDGGPIETMEPRRKLDVGALTWEQRDQLEQLLLTALKSKDGE